MSEERDPVDAMQWQRVEPALYWRAADRWVVADRHLPDGTRQHMVRGSAPAGLVVSAAHVIGEQEAVGAEFAAAKSHLSAPAA